MAYLNDPKNNNKAFKILKGNLNSCMLAWDTYLSTIAGKKHKNKEEKYIPVILWMVGLIKTSTMDFTYIKLPK